MCATREEEERVRCAQIGISRWGWRSLMRDLLRRGCRDLRPVAGVREMNVRRVYVGGEVDKVSTMVVRFWWQEEGGQ
jgi:hypothetical protein